MVDKCTTVSIVILVKPQSMEGNTETGLDVVEHCIDPAKFGHLIQMPPVSCDIEN